MMAHLQMHHTLITLRLGLALVLELAIATDSVTEVWLHRYPASHITVYATAGLCHGAGGLSQHVVRTCAVQAAR